MYLIYGSKISKRKKKIHGHELNILMSISLLIGFRNKKGGAKKTQKSSETKKKRRRFKLQYGTYG